MTITEELIVLINKYETGINNLCKEFYISFKKIMQKSKEGINAIRRTQKLSLNKLNIKNLYNLVYQSRIAPIYVKFDFDVINECIRERNFPTPLYNTSFYNFKQICACGMVYMRAIVALEDLRIANELIDRVLAVNEEFPHIEGIPFTEIIDEIDLVRRGSVKILTLARLTPGKLIGSINVHDRAQYSIAHKLKAFKTYIAELVLNTMNA